MSDRGEPMIHTQSRFRVDCDTAGCDATWPRTSWADDRRVMWREARAAGWERDYEQHRCPRCTGFTELVDRVRELACAGLTDGRIGVRLGVSRCRVQQLRNARSSGDHVPLPDESRRRTRQPAR